MGRRTRVAPAGPPGPQLVQPVEEAPAAAEAAGPEAPKAPEAPEEPEQAEAGQAPAPAEPSPAPATAVTAVTAVTAATPAVPVRKSIRILTRKDEPKTTPSQQTTETNPTTQTTQPAAIASQTHRTRITIAQLLQSPQPTRTTRQQAKTAHTTQQQLHDAETTLQKIDLNGQQHENDRPHEPYKKHEHHQRDETSEEEQLSKYSTRQHSQRQKKQPRQPSSQKNLAKKQHAASIPVIPSVQFYQVGLTPPPVTMIVERRIKLVTEQHNIPKAPQVEGYPMKEWTVEVYILDEAGKEKPARCFHKVVYNLHPSFVNPVQTFHEPPFKCTNEGWGEFEMTIDCYTTEKGGKQSILHDLNFANPTYENIHTIQFKNPSQALQAVLRETGPLPTDEDRKARKNLDGPGGSGAISKKKKTYDLEKMADAIPRLSEDDLLHVIQLIHDNKNDDTYIMNNPDAGEFSIDLYTMPDNLCRLMWEFLLQSPEGHRLR